MIVTYDIRRCILALKGLTKARAIWTTFKIKAAGAVSRSLYERIVENGLSIKDFGAVDDYFVDGSKNPSPTDNYEAIQNALTFCTENNIKLIGSGDYYLSSGVTGTCPMELDRAKFYYPTAFSGVAFQLGSVESTDGKTNRYKEMKLPQLFQDRVYGSSWSNSTGYKILNITSCDVYLTKVHCFGLGADITSLNSGNVHNRYFLGEIYSNKVNLSLTQNDGNGWVNENTFIGGRLGYFLDEVDREEGTKQIHLVKSASNPNNGANNNRFIGLSVEGEKEEVTIEIDDSCPFNFFLDLRYEGAGKVVNINSDRNTFMLGYGVSTVSFNDNGSRNSIYKDEEVVINGSSNTDEKGVLQLHNAFSANYPTLTIQDYTDKSKSTVRLSQSTVGVKTSSDSFDKWQLNSSGIKSGDGTSAPVFLMREWGAYVKVVRDIQFDNSNIGFYGAAVRPKQSVQGSTGGNAALESLIQRLAYIGLIENDTTS